MAAYISKSLLELCCVVFFSDPLSYFFLALPCTNVSCIVVGRAQLCNGLKSPCCKLLYVVLDDYIG